MDVERVLALAARARGKAKRLLLRAPLIKQWSNERYFAQLGRHTDELPSLDRDQLDVVNALRKTFLTTRDLTSRIPEDVLDVAERFVSRLRRDTSTGHCVRASQEELAGDLTLFKWGLSSANLDLAESYIGLPVAYLGLEVKRERPDGIARDVRQWHLDIEDRRMLKIIVYLSDVDDGAGPFEYIDRSLTQKAVRALDYWSGYVPDEAMCTAVDPSAWRMATGPRLTGVFVDTCRLFHRVKPPTRTDRYSMTFSYASSKPHQVFPELMQSRRTLLQLCAELTPRQRAALMT
jgi:hypothetical protein